MATCCPAWTARTCGLAWVAGVSAAWTAPATVKTPVSTRPMACASVREVITHTSLVRRRDPSLHASRRRPPRRRKHLKDSTFPSTQNPKTTYGPVQPGFGGSTSVPAVLRFTICLSPCPWYSAPMGHPLLLVSRSVCALLGVVFLTSVAGT